MRDYTNDVGLPQWHRYNEHSAHLRVRDYTNDMGLPQWHQYNEHSAHLRVVNHESRGEGQAAADSFLTIWSWWTPDVSPSCSFVLAHPPPLPLPPLSPYLLPRHSNPARIITSKNRTLKNRHKITRMGSYEVCIKRVWTCPATWNCACTRRSSLCQWLQASNHPEPMWNYAPYRPCFLCSTVVRAEHISGS